jgi:transcriptional regulator with XRE-family HTH domain
MLFSSKTEAAPNRLRELRGAARVSQWTVAQAAGIADHRYWRIENGRAEPTDAERAAIAKAFGVPVSRVFPSRRRKSARLQ